MKTTKLFYQIGIRNSLPVEQSRFNAVGNAFSSQQVTILPCFKAQVSVAAGFKPPPSLPAKKQETESKNGDACI